MRYLRGKEQRLAFSKNVGLPYTFVRSMEDGLVIPDEDVVADIAHRLLLDAEPLLRARKAQLRGHDEIGDT